MIQKTTRIQEFKNSFRYYVKEVLLEQINIKRTEKIIIEACEQSNRITVPKIQELQRLDEFIKNFPDNGKIVFCDINSESKI